MGESETAKTAAREAKNKRIDELRDSHGKTPSQVFAVRLRETRKARGYSQTDLASRMTEAGIPMSRPALARIEGGDRAVTLDEALAFADVLPAVPMQLLSPLEGEYLFTTHGQGLDGDAVRSWMRFGHPFGDVVGPAAEARQLDREVAVHARALVDAQRANDKAGMVEAIDAILKVAKREGI